jgi:hypothetical protein
MTNLKKKTWWEKSLGARMQEQGKWWKGR